MVAPELTSGALLDQQVLDTEFEVVAVESRSVELDLCEPMTLSFGTFASRPSGWLALSCEANGRAVMGYGEGATLPEPVFTDDSGHNIANNMQELVADIASQEDHSVRAAIQTIRDHAFVDGARYPTARLAAEMAVLDVATKSQQTSVREFIGLPASITEVPYGKSIGGANETAILRQAEVALENNAQKIKIKVSPGLFEDVVSAVAVLRRAHPGVDVMVDANGGFDPTNPDHLRMLRGLDEQGLIMVEEPVSRVGRLRGLSAVRALRQALPDLRTPICLDDSLQTLGDCETAVDEGLADIINIKPGRIGSFMQSLELADYANTREVGVMVGGMLEGTPGRCMTTLLGAYCMYQGCQVPGDLSLAQERLASDLVPPEKQLSLSPRGNILLPDGLGWGF